ncbi:MAG: hypothetical protein MJE77_37945 [Proteobacteria bacterium]|nr:hypothetical protein [Pseudomonadota bacterium]
MCLAIAGLATSGCRDGEIAAPSPESPAVRRAAASSEAAERADPVAQLRSYENRQRASVDFARLAPGDRVTGSNPFDIVRVPASATSEERFVGILRGADAVVLLDATGTELARLGAPRSPTGLAMAPDGEVYVSGEDSATVARYRANRSLERTGEVTLPGALAIVDIALGPEGILYAVEEFDGRILARSGRDVHEVDRCGGPLRVVREGDYLVVDCLLDRAIVVYPVDRRGMPASSPIARIQHDGPIWAIAAGTVASGLIIAAAGVEDHPLDRSDGSFGYIDSFVYMYEVDRKSGQVERWAAVNVAEHGLVTPKWLALTVSRAGHDSPANGAISVDVAGYGSGRRLALTFASRDAEVAVAGTDLPPGTAALARGEAGVVAANPLLDAWVAKRGDTTRVVSVAGPPRQAQLRLGEALFFTTLMAPWNPSNGHLSRFTCETCHFEGYVDGRTHFTGRGMVHATTKPLLGLFNNRPHFSRALDRTMATMVHNEFRVANRGSGRDSWFSLDTTGFPWLAHVGDLPPTLSPIYLRGALMNFLMEFTHRANPAVAGRRGFDDRERSGAEIFEQRCEGCHNARLIADAATSRVPPRDWEKLIFSAQGPIVWGRAEYRKTGVEPYVHDRGARVPSLRRLYKKRPYFTNGSAANLAAVLQSIRVGTDPNSGQPGFLHAGEGAGLHALSDGEQRALLAFLRLL